MTAEKSFKTYRNYQDKKTGVVFLNVANLQRHENGKTLKFIEKAFCDMNYSFFLKILDSAKFGVPQSKTQTIYCSIRLY